MSQNHMLDAARDIYKRASISTGAGNDQKFTNAVARRVGTTVENLDDLASRFRIEAAVMLKAADTTEKLQRGLKAIAAQTSSKR